MTENQDSRLNAVMRTRCQRYDLRTSLSKIKLISELFMVPFWSARVYALFCVSVGVWVCGVRTPGSLTDFVRVCVFHRSVLCCSDRTTQQQHNFRSVLFCSAHMLMCVVLGGTPCVCCSVWDPMCVCDFVCCSVWDPLCV